MGWDTFRWVEQFFGKSFSVVGFASGSNFKCAGFFPRGLFLVLVVWALSFKGLVQRIFFWLFPPVNLLCRAVEYPVLFRSGGVY